MSQTLQPSSDVTPPPSAKRNQRTALAMMAVFLAPVIIAYVLLKTGVYQDFGTSNRGTLFDPPQELLSQNWQLFENESSNQALTPAMIAEHWWLAYEMPAECDATCEQRLVQIRQTIKALGPEKQRVNPLIIMNADSDTKSLLALEEQLEGFGKTVLSIRAETASATDTSADQSVEALLRPDNSSLSNGGLYVIDPMGFIMLYYAPASGEQEAIPQAKSLIKDLKYMLKVSRIG